MGRFASLLSGTGAPKVNNMAPHSSGGKFRSELLENHGFYSCRSHNWRGIHQETCNFDNCRTGYDIKR